ncbi:MAG: CSLREA domain-containing protein [Xanthomonadales bacterium]|nr:CSLREA domain-containing protein [Xanthomonadales bacterium]
MPTSITTRPWRRALPALCLLALSSPLLAAEFIINTTADAPDTNPGDGQCTGFGLPPSARCSLRAAIMEANAQGGTHLIGLPEGDYILDEAGIDEDQAVTGDLDIRADITIVNGSAALPFIGQQVGDRLFEVHPTASLTLQHVGLGGGEALNGARPFGGAVLVWYAADLSIERSYLFGNRASKGGAVHVWGDALIVDSALEFNFLVDPAPDDDNQGSAIAVERTIFAPAQLGLVRSSLSDNGEVEFNGNLVPNSYALLVEDGAKAQIFNSSIIDNTRGIWVRSASQLDMGQSTIANNRSFGLRFDHNPDNPDPRLTALFTVIAGNGGVAQCRSASAFFLNPNLTQLDVVDHANAATDVSCGFVGASDVALDGSPFHPQAMQQDLTRYYLPVPGRGLVDAGGPTCMGPDDQRNAPKPVNGSGQAQALCDIGAIEFDPQTDPGLPDQLLSDGFED